MAKRVRNISFVDFGGHDEVYTDVLTIEEIRGAEGVERVAKRMFGNGVNVYYCSLYDKQSVRNDLTEMADEMARAMDLEDICEETPKRNKEFEKMILQEYLKEEPPFNAELDICVYQQRPYTHAIVVYKTLWSGHGYSKCNPIDEWDEDLGALIAVKRAARDLYQRMPNNYSQKKGN